MLCSREIFTDQSYHACIRSEKNPSIRSDSCMTEYYACGQPASAWPLAGQPCSFDCNLHTIARAHNRTFFVRLVRALCPHVPAVESSIMCTPIMHSTRSKLMPKWHFFLYFWPARSLHVDVFLSISRWVYYTIFRQKRSSISVCGARAPLSTFIPYELVSRLARVGIIRYAH